MAEYKHIKYVARLSEDRTRVSVQITEQTHINNEFGDNLDGLDEFRCEESNTILYSYGHPAFGYVDGCSLGVYMRGDASELDDREIAMKLEEYKRFKQAVLAYNKHFSGEADNV